MILAVTEENLDIAAGVHSVSWQESHRGFCSVEFVAVHTPRRQAEYLRNKMTLGTKIFLLEDAEPAGIVSVTGDWIEELYVLPEKQNQGYGSQLLRYAIAQCQGIPRLWVLENNRAAQLYERMGLRLTERKNSSGGKLAEIEYSL